MGGKVTIPGQPCSGRQLNEDGMRRDPECGDHQVRLNPAAMLWVLVSEPGSLIEAVSLIGPSNFCSRRSLLCHWLSRLDAPALAESVVPDDRKVTPSD
jgi:hypothetical protein